MPIPQQLENVTAVPKANIYFDGRVVSHTLLSASGGERKTLGLIYPGRFHFGTDKAERLEIVAGACAVQIDGRDAVQRYETGATFEIPGKSGFHIEVASGICEYICT